MNGDEVWDFARSFYEDVGVSPALLRLQDEHDADIPLILVLLQAAGEGTVIPRAELEDLMHVAGDWARDVVQPLRAARRELKGGDTVRYEEAKARELAAEEAIIRRLSARVSARGHVAPLEAACANLESYRELLGLAGGSFDTVLAAFAARVGRAW